MSSDLPRTLFTRIEGLNCGSGGRTTKRIAISRGWKGETRPCVHGLWALAYGGVAPAPRGELSAVEA